MLRGTVSPTEMNRPFLIVTTRATVLRPSIVWMSAVHQRDRLVSRCGGRRCRVSAAATSGVAEPAAAPMAAAVAAPKNPLREMSDMPRIV